MESCDATAGEIYAAAELRWANQKITETTNSNIETNNHLMTGGDLFTYIISFLFPIFLNRSILYRQTQEELRSPFSIQIVTISNWR